MPTVVSGSITDRLTDAPIGSSTITFTGARTYTAAVSDGRFSLEMPAGQYAVSIDGTSHVPHRTEIVYVSGAEDLAFTVLRWGQSLFGATYDETFHEVFHQMARIRNGSSVTGIRKWVIPPSEIYLVEGTVPLPAFQLGFWCIPQWRSRYPSSSRWQNKSLKS